MCEKYNRALRYDRMVSDKENDELGLFEKYDEVLCEIRRKIMECNASKVIDIGCGTGNLCGELSDKIEVVGLDKNMEMISYAKEKYNNMKFKLGDFLDKPFKSNYYDVVVTSYAFHGLNDDEKKIAIKNMIGYLNEKGKIIITDFMFLNEIEREECKVRLCSQNREDLWEVISNKYYSNLTMLEMYIKELGYSFSKKHITNFTWIVEIKEEFI